MRKQQWDQIVALSKETYQNRRFMSVPKQKQQKEQHDFYARILPQGIVVGDVYHNLSVDAKGILLNGKPITTSQDKQTTKELLDRFYSVMNYDDAAQARQAAEQKRRSVIRHAVQHEPQALTVRQLGRLRSIHRQFSSLGQKQLETQKILRQNRWPTFLLRDLSVSKKKEIVSHQLDNHRGYNLARRFPRSDQVHRITTNIFSLPEYRNKSFLWYSTEGSNEAEERFSYFVCIVRCVMVRGATSTPCFLCTRYWKSKRWTQPISENVWDLIVIPVDRNQPLLHEQTFPLSPYDFHNLLRKIVLRQDIVLRPLQATLVLR